MSQLRNVGIGVSSLASDSASFRQVVVQNPLHRVLAFTGDSIDKVVDSPVAKRRVYSFFKLHKWVQRRCEIVELERQWNG